ncbi:MAG: phosphate transport system permease protein [Myxococcota bacterium]|jgi:phosphate transport system permease protein
MIEGRASRPAEHIFAAAGLLATLLPLLLAAVLFTSALSEALPALPRASGLGAATASTLKLSLLTALLSIPPSIGAAIYLEECRPRGALSRRIEQSIAYLAGVPPVIYGLLGLEVFGRLLGLGSGLLACAATLALLVFPLVVFATRESLRSVPDSLREGAYALGASRLQVIGTVVLPLALPGIAAGALLATARALGEAAPLVVLGASAALPAWIFHQLAAGRQAEAAAGVVVLLTAALLLSVLGLAARALSGRRA